MVDEFDKVREVTQTGLQTLVTGFTNTALYKLKVELAAKQEQVVYSLLLYILSIITYLDYHFVFFSRLINTHTVQSLYN